MSAYACDSANAPLGLFMLSPVPATRYRCQSRSRGIRAQAFCQLRGFATSMARLRARALRGKRAYGKVPRNRGKNTTLIAAITLQGGMGESMTVEGATDALAFEAYVEHFLAPSLCEGQVVVLDGLGAHRTEKVRELIEGGGAESWPVDGPDYVVAVSGGELV